MGNTTQRVAEGRVIPAGILTFRRSAWMGPGSFAAFGCVWPMSSAAPAGAGFTLRVREKGEAGAVLFWDEVDAMFYDRDTDARSWEVRDVNVLLQELERFEGVCILATNRTVALNPALERRALEVSEVHRFATWYWSRKRRRRARGSGLAIRVRDL